MVATAKFPSLEMPLLLLAFIIHLNKSEGVPMNTRDVLLSISSFWLLLVVFTVMTYSLSLQAQIKETVVTDSRDLTGAASPRRVIVTRTEQDGRTIETRVIEGPSINGGYALLSETEQQTIQLNPNAITVVTRQYSRDANGNRQLLGVTEEQRSTAATGQETILRTTSSADLNGRLQVDQRELQETVPTSDGTWQTTSTISRQTANGFQPVLRSQQVEQRKGDVAERRTTVLVPDGNGNFVLLSRTESTTMKTASGQAKDERIYGENGHFGRMTLLQRDVTTESTNPRESHSTTQTYSVFVPGASPAARKPRSHPAGQQFPTDCTGWKCADEAATPDDQFGQSILRLAACDLSHWSFADCR